MSVTESESGSAIGIENESEIVTVSARGTETENEIGTATTRAAVTTMNDSTTTEAKSRAQNAVISKHKEAAGIGAEAVTGMKIGAKGIDQRVDDTTGTGLIVRAEAIRKTKKVSKVHVGTDLFEPTCFRFVTFRS